MYDANISRKEIEMDIIQSIALAILLGMIYSEIRGIRKDLNFHYDKLLELEAKAEAINSSTGMDKDGINDTLKHLVKQLVNQGLDYYQRPTFRDVEDLILEGIHPVIKEMKEHISSTE